MLAVGASRRRGDVDRRDLTFHHGASSDAERDQAPCETEAKAAPASDKSTPSKPGETAATGAAVGDGIVIAEKRIELTRACMQARGDQPR